MTTSAAPRLTGLLRRTTGLLLDFDGPVCSIFAGRPSRTIAVELLGLLRDADVPVPTRLDCTRDPLEVLRYAATIDRALAARVERYLRDAEIDAAQTAVPTSHAREFINTWRRSDRPAAIVSNNSAAAVAAYLAAQDVDVDAVAARTDPDPALLKPNPHLVLEAIRALAVDPVPGACVLVGDSISDVLAAREAGIDSIGYANADGKREALADAGATIVVDDMATLSRAAGS